MLKFIDDAKKKGVSLDGIRQNLQQKVLLSQEGRDYILRFKASYPETAFRPGAPLTRAEFAFMLAQASKERGRGKRLFEFIKDFIIDPSGVSAFEGFDLEVEGIFAGRTGDGPPKAD